MTGHGELSRSEVGPVGPEIRCSILCSYMTTYDLGTRCQTFVVKFSQCKQVAQERFEMSDSVKA